jgi:serine/threonine protein phosphatase PrpC
MAKRYSARLTLFVSLVLLAFACLVRITFPGEATIGQDVTLANDVLESFATSTVDAASGIATLTDSSTTSIDDPYLRTTASLFTTSSSNDHDRRPDDGQSEELYKTIYVHNMEDNHPQRVGNVNATAKDALSATLSRLITKRSRPTTEQWRWFRTICRDTNNQDECEKIFDYFRRVLIPLTFPTVREITDQWDGHIGAIGLPKGAPADDVKVFTDYNRVREIGDDSHSFGGDFLMISDGITRHSASDFFSWQVVSFLTAGMRRLDEHSPEGIEGEIFDLIKSLEDLIIAVELPAAGTLSVAVLSRDGRYLSIASLGDSEVKVIRPSSGKLIYRSPMQRTSNVPGQLNFKRPSVAKQMKIERVKVKPGDWIIMASDGLWDNLHEDEVVKLLSDDSVYKKRVSSLLQGLMAQVLDRRGHTLKTCKDVKRRDNSKKTRCVGGRVDDITIILGRL